LTSGLAEAQVMNKLRSILFATDFRAPAQTAALAAAKLAELFKAHVTVLHVVPTEHALSALAQVVHEEATRQLARHSDALCRRHVTVDEAATTTGQPADKILQKAQEIAADLIVLGAGERRFGDHFVPGPVAEIVLQHAAAPVLAVRPGEPELSFRTIVCPVDNSPASERGLRNAVGLARATRASLVVLTVVPEVTLLGAALETHQLTGALDQHEDNWREQFRQVVQATDFQGVPWSAEVVRGAPHEQIIQAVQRTEADLLVMGSHGRSALTRLLLGSVTRRVLQQLPCSLLTLRTEDAFAQMYEEDVRFQRLLTAEGQELLKNDMAGRAANKFRQVLALNPYFLPALEGLAAAHDKQGEADKAAYCRKKAALVRQSA
jgi:nucleotide-binding universal stress UspA family protein